MSRGEDLLRSAPRFSPWAVCQHGVANCRAPRITQRHPGFRRRRQRRNLGFCRQWRCPRRRDDTTSGGTGGNGQVGQAGNAGGGGGGAGETGGSGGNGAGATPGAGGAGGTQASRNGGDATAAGAAVVVAAAVVAARTALSVQHFRAATPRVEMAAKVRTGAAAAAAAAVAAVVVSARSLAVQAVSAR